jgi:type I restriction enzyme, S subunit
MTEPTALLGDVGTVVMGLSPKGEYVSTNPMSGLPLLNGPTEFGAFSPKPRQWASEWAREADPGDTLFCVRGSTTGRMNVAQTTYAIGRGIAAIRGGTALDTVFIRYAIVKGLPRLLSLTSGSVFPNISASDLKGFEMPWPDTSKRHDIAATLSALDEKIQSNFASISLMESLARAHFDRAAAF